MKAKPTAEYNRFARALRKVVRVSHSELQTRIAADKAHRALTQKPRGAAAHASREKG